MISEQHVQPDKKKLQTLEIQRLIESNRALRTVSELMGKVPKAHRLPLAKIIADRPQKP